MIEAMNDLGCTAPKQQYSSIVSRVSPETCTKMCSPRTLQWPGRRLVFGNRDVSSGQQQRGCSVLGGNGTRWTKATRRRAPPTRLLLYGTKYVVLYAAVEGGANADERAVRTYSAAQRGAARACCLLPRAWSLNLRALRGYANPTRPRDDKRNFTKKKQKKIGDALWTTGSSPVTNVRRLQHYLREKSLLTNPCRN